MFRYFHRRADMTRNPLLEEEENNRNGAAPLTDAEITEFTEAVVYSRSVIPDVPSVWLEGYKVAATFPHGLGMSISPVSRPSSSRTTAWPKPVRL